MNPLPYNLYTASQVRELDRVAIEDNKIPSFTLMTRAATAAFKASLKHWPHYKKMAVICGCGNNAGDGFVFSRLAKETGIQVTVFLLTDPKSLKGDALRAFDELTEKNLTIKNFHSDDFSKYDLVVDALFGSGLCRPIEGIFKEAVDCINKAGKPVLSIDIPSGLNADTGEIMGTAVKANASISFIGLKRGMFTAHGPEFSGTIHFDDLGVPAHIYDSVPANVSRIDFERLLALLSLRPKDSHKNQFGHTLVVGGNLGMAGAAKLCAEAALRTGSGLVSVATRSEHASILTEERPEIMSHGIEKVAELKKRIDLANVIALGPGLGQDSWAKQMYKTCLNSKLPLIVDADALNLLAQNPLARGNWILTPHPGEAARLLNCSNKAIEKDRFAAVKRIAKKYKAIVVLKGCGSLVSDNKTPATLCDLGNPGMSSGGMGDALTGIIAGLVAQKISPLDAAKLGTCLHAKAADIAVANGERGLIASDLFDPLRKLVNPTIRD